MTYPQQGYYPPQQGYPQTPPQGYNGPPPPMGYGGQQPAFYPPPQQPMQGYGPPQQPQVPPSVPGTLEAFDNQRASSAGKPLKFPTVGTQYLVRVARDITDSDVRQMTDFTTKAPINNTDGTAKMQLCLPGVIAPDAEHPTGGCTLYIKPGAWRDEYNRALAEAGTTGHARAGSVFWVVYASQRASGFGQPAKVPQMVYYPPETADATLGPLAPPHAPLDGVSQQGGQPYPAAYGAQPPVQQPLYQPAPPQQPHYAPPQGYPPQLPQQPAYAPQAAAQPPAQPQYVTPPQAPSPQQHLAQLQQGQQAAGPDAGTYLAPPQQAPPQAQPQYAPPQQPPAPPAPQPPQAPAGAYTGDPQRDAYMAQLTGYAQPAPQG